MKKISLLVCLFQLHVGYTQTWPSETWQAAINLTNVMDVSGVTDLSGLHWNPTNNRLYGIQNKGKFRVLELNTANNTFNQIANKSISGGPEGITQANLYANEFYTIDEDNYEIRRYTYTSNFSSITLHKHWNILLSPSTMTDTGNTGPEGIVFIPDNILTAAGFISQQTGKAYISVKGLGGLIFVAHQDKGYLWVFDINPNSNDDFAFVGKYKTSRTESCDLSLDRSTGLLYILHNISGKNKLEVTDLSTVLLNGSEREFVVKSEYTMPITGDSNDNIEGFAITSKCPESGTTSAWLCRDVSTSENDAIQQDALRWFYPFTADGTCNQLANSNFESNSITIYPNPSKNRITVSSPDKSIQSIQISNSLGQIVQKIRKINNTSTVVDVSQLQAGIYLVEITQAGKILRRKLIKD